MTIPDSLPEFAFFLGSICQINNKNTQSSLWIQLALKSAICSESDWLSFENCLTNMNFDIEFEEYIRLICVIGRLRDRSPLDHFLAVSKFRQLYPEDSFLDRPFCWTVDAVQLN